MEPESSILCCNISTVHLF